MLADDLGLCQTGSLGGGGLTLADGTGGRSHALGLGERLESFGFGQGLDPVFLRLSRLLHRRLQLLLPSQDFLLLHLDALLFLNHLNLDFLGPHLLVGDILLKRVSQFGLGLLAVCLHIVFGFLDLVLLLRFSDSGLSLILGGFPLLAGAGRRDGCIPRGLGLADFRVPLHLGGTLATQCVQVALVVADILDGEGDDTQSHVGHIAGGYILNPGGESIPVFVDLFHRHCAQDGPQVAFQCLQGHVANLVT